MTAPLQLLASFHDRGSAEITGRRLEAMFGESANFVLENNIFGKGIGQDQVPCRCPEGDHAASVKWSADRGAYRARCPNGDKFDVPPEEVETHAFNVDAFCRAACRALGVMPRKGRKWAERAVHYSGDAMLGCTQYPVFLVQDIHAPRTLDEILDLDSRKIGHSRGVFLCAALPPEALQRDCFHAFATFGDVLDLQDGQLQRRSDTLRKALGDAIQKMPRERTAELLTAIAEQYRREHGKLPSVRDLPGFAAQFWPEDQTPPGKTTCAERLKQLRSAT